MIFRVVQTHVIKTITLAPLLIRLSPLMDQCSAVGRTHFDEGLHRGVEHVAAFSRVVVNEDIAFMEVVQGAQRDVGLEGETVEMVGPVKVSAVLAVEVRVRQHLPVPRDD